MYLLNLFHMQIFYLQNLLNGLKTVVFLIALRIGPASSPLHNSSNRVRINVARLEIGERYHWAIPGFN